MSETTPPWRAFSSQATDEAAAPPQTSPRRRVPRWLLPALAGVGGLGLGVAVVIAVVLAIGLAPVAVDDLRAPDALGATTTLDLPATDAPPSGLVVDVAGAVVRPGLHRLRAGDRVGDAIEAAGGYAPRADLVAASTTLNLAQPLEDGAKVLVPELGIDRATSSGARDDGRIDLNAASGSELETLPGIGPVTAGKIIDAREDERFGNVRELRSRGIVGEKVFEDIKSLVRAS